MPAKIPPPASEAIRIFEDLIPSGPTIGVKKVFGQPAGFVNGNMFMGVFGEEVFIRLSEAEGRDSINRHGLQPFEPMPGRPMRGYVVLPRTLLADKSASRKWVAKSLEFSRSLPPK